MTKLIGYARVRRGSSPQTGSRRIFWPPASDAMTFTLITVFLGRELHDPSSIVHSTR
ncbi:UNVERIFIED_ORG: hypothetical protein ABIB52_004694 [Arthrobacter sp. UYCu721]